MIKLKADNTILCGDGVILNDHSPDTQCAKSLALREIFPYLKDYVQPDCEEVLTFNGKFVRLECFPIENGERCDCHKHTIYPLDDLSGYSERVQTACKCFFTPEVKQAFIASLPRVRNPVKSERVRMHKKIHEDGEHVEIVQVEEEITDDGELIPAHPEEVRYDLVPVTLNGELVMEEYDTEEVETFIVYKDKLYPEDWNGDISAAV